MSTPKVRKNIAKAPDEKNHTEHGEWKIVVNGNTAIAQYTTEKQAKAAKKIIKDQREGLTYLSKR